jgi:predicted GNAT superfamily acetyltransferase
MPPIHIEHAKHDHFGSILALNDAEVQQTSAMDLARLRTLDALASYHAVAVVDGVVAAFLLAMRDGAPYANDNYAWFAARFVRFVYVDRIVVGRPFVGRGIGRSLYEDLFAYARGQGIATIACEYNIEPPNPDSRKFHDTFGFKEIGRQWLGDHTKQVSLQVAQAHRLRGDAAQ